MLKRQLLCIICGFGPALTQSSRWLFDMSKWIGLLVALREVLGIDLESQLDRWFCLCDSPSDEKLLQHMHHTIGVGNMRPHLPNMTFAPRWITRRRGGEGFADSVGILDRKGLLQVA